MEGIRVLLAEADPGVRRLVEGFFQEYNDLQLCGEAGDGFETLELVMQLRPQVLLLSLELPCLDGLSVLRQLWEKPPEAPLSVVVISKFTDKQVVEYTLHLGARYYLIKPVSYRELLRTIRWLETPSTLGLEVQAERMLFDMLELTGGGGTVKPSKGLRAAASAAAALSVVGGEKMLLKEAYYSSIITERTDYACVEKNIRYLVSRIHSIGSEHYGWMMGGVPLSRPDNDTFLRALAQKLRG